MWDWALKREALICSPSAFGKASADCGGNLEMLKLLLGNGY